MNTVPAIGRARGLFEIFVPGVFLLLNLGVALCLLPLDRSFLSRNPSDWVSPPVCWTTWDKRSSSKETCCLGSREITMVNPHRTTVKIKLYRSQDI
jgi:hypothetical protein